MNQAAEIRVALSKTQLADVRRAVAALDLPAAKRHRLVWRMGRAVIRYTRANARAQHTPEGAGWPKRRHGKRKMIRKLASYLVQRAVYGGEGTRIVFDRGGKKIRPGMIAGWQQRGATISMNAGRPATDRSAQTQTKKPASRRQARALVRLGYTQPVAYTVSRRRGTRRRVAAKWITENMSAKQAGLIIRKMRNQPEKNAWQIVLPGRPFLGVSDSQVAALIAREVRGIGYGYNVKNSDIRRK